ncbi:MAG: ATP-binding protein [Spirochaetota bacterium]
MWACEDDGPGIGAAERKHVFERFYRIDKDRNRSTGGSGLGLAIVREIVRRHNGKVYFENPRVLDGARIVVELQQNGKN